MGSRVGLIIIKNAKSSKQFLIEIVRVKNFERTQTNATGGQCPCLVQAQSIHAGQNLNSRKFLNKRASTSQSCRSNCEIHRGQENQTLRDHSDDARNSQD